MSDEVQITFVDMSLELPSEYNPVAVSWSSWIAFRAIEGLGGVMVRETNPGTVIVVVPVTLPAAAEIVEDPTLNMSATPALPVELLMLATAGLEEVQITA